MSYLSDDKLTLFIRKMWDFVLVKIGSVLGISLEDGCITIDKGVPVRLGPLRYTTPIGPYNHAYFDARRPSHFEGDTESTKGYCGNLYIDASASGAKWYVRDNSEEWNVQVNAGVKIYVPLMSGKKYRMEDSRIAINIYDTSAYIIGDEIIKIGGTSYRCIDITENTWLNNISCSQKTYAYCTS